jgi:hypothetical protein
MVADAMTKIVSSAQDGRLASRFYNDVDEEKLKKANDQVAAMSAQVMMATATALACVIPHDQKALGRRLAVAYQS